MNFLNDFVDFLNKHEFIANVENIKADGKFHRIKHISDKRGKTSGSYVLFADGIPAAFVQNFKFDQSFTWKYKDTKKQNDFDPIKFAKIREGKAARQENFYRKNALSAFNKFKNLSNKPFNNTYLDKKQVKAYGIKFDEDNNLYIPYRNNDGYIQTLQIISPEGNKKFLFGCKKSGAYHKIGFYTIDKLDGQYYYGKIFVGEGYATMASVYMATKIPSVVAGDAGNLIHIVRELKQKYPNAEIIICADNDAAGLKKASECKQEFNTRVVIPDLSNNNLTDFNDLQILKGSYVVKDQIFRQLN